MENDFTKKDDVYDPNFSIDGSNTEKLDMYGVWLKNKKETDQSDETSFSKLENMEDDSDENTINFDDAFSDTFSADEQHDDIAEIDEFNDLRKENDNESDTDLKNQETLGEEQFESLDLDDFFDDSETETISDTAHTDTEEPAEISELDFLDDDESEGNTEQAPAGLENFSEISLEDFEDETGSDDSAETHDELETLHDLSDASNEDTPHQDEIRKTPGSFDISVTADDEENKIQSPAELSSQSIESTDDIPIFDSAPEPA